MHSVTLYLLGCAVCECNACEVLSSGLIWCTVKHWKAKCNWDRENVLSWRMARREVKYILNICTLYDWHRETHKQTNMTLDFQISECELIFIRNEGEMYQVGANNHVSSFSSEISWTLGRLLFCVIVSSAWELGIMGTGNANMR